MEALSPRSTNQMLKPKVPMERKVLDRNAAAASAAQKAASSKNHAPPPPPIVSEPSEDGERYRTGNFLGKGGFAVCYEGTLQRNGRVFAMKVVRSEMTQKKMQEKVPNPCAHRQHAWLLTQSCSSVPSFRSIRKCDTRTS